MQMDALLLVIILSGLVVVLVVTQFFLAARHDHVISSAPKHQSIESLDEQIHVKKNTISDLEDELEKRRESIGRIADVQSDFDALERKLDGLNTEWDQVENRREELRELRVEIEDKALKKVELDSDCKTLSEQYDSIKEKVDSAESLFKQVDEKTAKLENIESELSDLEPKFQKLSNAEKELAEVIEKTDELNKSVKELSGKQGRLLDAVEELDELHESSKVKTKQAVGEAEQLKFSLNASRHVEAELEVKITALEARKAVLDKENDDGGSVGGIDPLHELKEVPPVLSSMDHWGTRPTIRELDALHSVHDRLDALGLQYHARTINAFHTAMKVNESSQMAVLAGISGTGKSQLPRQYAAGMGIGFLQVPVQPRWDSPQDLMGFYNYIEKRYRPTDMAKALYHLDAINNKDSIYGDNMMMILLDEMNLARVEYYFSDFLSRLESRPLRNNLGNETLRKDAEIEIELPMINGLTSPRIFPGYNLLFAGTMNEDESTQSLSDKVVDRANVIRFAAPKKIKPTSIPSDLFEPELLKRSNWESWIQDVGRTTDSSSVNDTLNEMVEMMRQFQRPFGHRLGKSVLAYVANYPEGSASNSERNALADQVEMRLLPKLRGVEVDASYKPFNQMINLVRQDLGDQDLADAIQNSMDSAIDGTGQFVWKGVTRL